MEIDRLETIEKLNQFQFKFTFATLFWTEIIVTDFYGLFSKQYMYKNANYANFAYYGKTRILLHTAITEAHFRFHICKRT